MHEDCQRLTANGVLDFNGFILICGVKIHDELCMMKCTDVCNELHSRLSIQVYSA